MNTPGNLRSDLYSAFYQTDTSEVIEFVKWLAAAYDISEPAKILDIGCGTGRMLREFGTMGWETLGMEPDPDYITQALLVAEEFENVTVLPKGFAGIEETEEFNIIAAINGPFSYLIKIEDRIDTLRRMFQALKPGGILFLDLANFLWILNNFKDRTARTATRDGKTINLVVHHSADFHNCIFTSEELFFWDDPEEGQVRIEETHHFAITSLSELLYLIKNQGFTKIKTYNSYKARKNEKITGPRLMISAQKPR
ncbi:MAG: class I SAM-dependent methyltransferase [Microcoleus vaginatus WJT46-NPBG5]|jgi:SAM-dependent methyltransferase|nr:class I SAM-dependent methyltransferase [Microcoleus vaginatus WJT46-NPBG5]